MQDNYGLELDELVSLGRGYTNRSYHVRTSEECFVLRRSWQGKGSRQVQRENQVLDYLVEHSPAVETPRLVPTVSGAKFLEWNSEYLHLFRVIEGDCPYLWKEKCTESHSRGLMKLLASLHGQLLGMSVEDASCPLRIMEGELRLLEEKTDQICSDERVSRRLTDTLTKFFEKGHLILNRASQLSAFDEPLLWCHGDFQLENFLFAADEVVGIVDFDTVRAQPRKMDLAFALFHMSRDASSDVEFGWNDTRWHQCVQYYKEHDTGERGDALPSAEDWRDLFCLDQALLHLHAGRNRIWKLREGIGFMAPYLTVLRA